MVSLRYAAKSLEFSRPEFSGATVQFNMKKLVALLSLSFMAAASYANNCPNEMKAIDAKLATKPALAAADMDKLKTLRADGEKFHKEGKHTESMKALGDGKKLLGI